jgi:SAM-dependent methyltransferase
MKTKPDSAQPLFDEFAQNYNQALERGIGVSGEKKEFFAQERVRWLERCLASFSFQPRRVLDFGCGTGSATPFLLSLPGVESVVGVDVSEKELAIARQEHRYPHCTFQMPEEFKNQNEIDLVFCNGVFHHIPPEHRDQAVSFIRAALRPGGLFAFWENNPWNPGTRYVMSRIPFDKDAVVLSAPESRRLLARQDFKILRTDFLFIFPRVLAWFRRAEPFLARFPLGAQYQVLAERP